MRLNSYDKENGVVYFQQLHGPLVTPYTRSACQYKNQNDLSPIKREIYNGWKFHCISKFRKVPIMYCRRKISHDEKEHISLNSSLIITVKTFAKSAQKMQLGI